MSWICLYLLAGFLAVAALIDTRTRRLPNWLTACIALLYGFFVLSHPAALPWPWAMALAALVLVGGFALFACNLIGGGDAKLLAALSLWAGPDHLLLLLVITSLSGGILAFCMMTLAMYRPWLVWTPASVQPCDQGLAKTLERGVRSARSISVPYGVAIAIGGLAVIFAHLDI